MRAHRGSSATDGIVSFEGVALIVVILHSSYGTGSTMPPILVWHTPVLAFKSSCVRAGPMAPETPSTSSGHARCARSDGLDQPKLGQRGDAVVETDLLDDLAV